MRKFCSALILALSLSAGAQEIPPVGVTRGLSDEQLMETVQRQTFRFFWHGAHPLSGMALERSNTVRCDFYWDYINEADDEPNLSKGSFGPDACAVGGTGFGILATIVAVERGWIGREQAVDRLTQIADFLNKADCYHGIYPHFIDGRSGKTIPFGRLDDGSDIVETSYLMMGFLCARQYFNHGDLKERYLCKRINEMWDAANWNWHAQNGKFFWHWSPENGFDMNFPVYGWDEALITYIISASSKWHPIDKRVYLDNWVGSQTWKNGRSYYGIQLPLGNFDDGGPLFFEQYTFMGVDPNGLKDEFGIDYAQQARAHTLINRAYCLANPKKYAGYSEKCWGLTAGDSVKGYVAHCPQDDRGVIQPTAALSSMPFTPRESMQALRYFYEERGADIWSPYGFVDGFSDQHHWVASSHLAIDQGPIIVMIENHRSGLIWKLFMSIPEVQSGLRRLGFRVHKGSEHS
ncbi:MAG: glucoamylase family protein [Vulcanimicrobiota bacterium]